MIRSVHQKETAQWGQWGRRKGRHRRWVRARAEGAPHISRYKPTETEEGNRLGGGALPTCSTANVRTTPTMRHANASTAAKVALEMKTQQVKPTATATTSTQALMTARKRLVVPHLQQPRLLDSPPLHSTHR
jgi:hypothetical protein